LVTQMGMDLGVVQMFR